MIFGSPDKFAIYLDEVEEWSSDGFTEGFICFYVNSMPFPSNFFDYVSTLNLNLNDFLGYALLNPKIDNALFEKDKLELVKYLLKNRYPAYAFNSKKEFDLYEYEDKDEDYDYSIEADFLERADISMFVIRNQKIIRLLVVDRNHCERFFNLGNLKIDDIVEVYIKYDELMRITHDTINFHKKL